MPSVKILVVSHKPFKNLPIPCFVPIHAGRAVAMEKSKDGKINNSDLNWMLENTIGDDTGDNISQKNRYYCECSALYWAWKNYEKLGNPDYIGLMHYRRHFIFNDDYFENNLKDDWHRALSYISENFIDDRYLSNIGLSEENIISACKNYDFVVSKDTNFELIGGYNIRQNYEKTIPGVCVKDFDLMCEIIKKDYPQYIDVIDKNIDGYKTSLYQMFIMPKSLFFEYCEFLFDILFKIEGQVNFENYTTNGKRTLGYLAERVLSVFVWKKQEENYKILKLGVSEVEYPYELDDLAKIIKKGAPSYFSYLLLKIKSFFLKGKSKQSNKETRQSIRRQIKSYKKLKNLLKIS